MNYEKYIRQIQIKRINEIPLTDDEKHDIERYDAQERASLQLRRNTDPVYQIKRVADTLDLIATILRDNLEVTEVHEDCEGCKCGNCDCDENGVRE